MEKTLVKTKPKGYKMLLTIAACVLLFLLCTLVFFVNNFDISLDDYMFHSNRIIGVANAIRDGRFPIKYYDNFMDNAGYFSPIFYGDLFLLLPALLVICGVSPVASFFIFTYLLALALAISMYFLLRKYISNKYLCVIGATYFVLSTYIFSDMFRRGAIGETLGIVFMIWLFVGMKNMLDEDFSKPWILSIAFLGMLLSHCTTFILGAIVLVAVVLVNAKKLLTKKSFYLKALFAFSIFLAGGLYFICSFVEMYISDTFYISKPWVYFSSTTYSLSELLLTSPYGAGIICLLPLILRLLFIRKKTADEETRLQIKTIDKLLIVAYIITFITLDIFPWKWLDKMLLFLQFTWRLFSITHILFAVALTLEIYIILQKDQFKLIMRILIVFVSMYFVVYNNLIIIDHRYVRNDYNIAYPYEWFPVSVENMVHKEEDGTFWMDTTTAVFDQDRNEVEFERAKYDTRVTFLAEDDDTYYIVPIIFYKGYEATITLEDGTQQKLEIFKDEYGYIGVSTNKLSGKIEVKYAGTATQTVTYLISLISTIGICGLAMTLKIIKRKSKKIEKNS